MKEFQELGVEAWGIENNAHIHRRTPAALRRRNLLGDVRSLPFESDFFDFAYETCLCYLPPRDVEQAIRELHRVVKIGVHFGDITSDMTSEVIEEHDLLYAVQTVMTLWQWSDLFLKNGFRLASISPQSLRASVANRNQGQRGRSSVVYRRGRDALLLLHENHLRREIELHVRPGASL